MRVFPFIFMAAVIIALMFSLAFTSKSNETLRRVAADQEATIAILKSHRLTHSDTLEILYWITTQEVKHKAKK
jgi:hypothetical protein